MNEKIGLQDLVVLLAEKANITKKDAEALVKECFDTMEEGLFEDKILKIRNLGTFKLIQVEDRESVNVSTGERVLIPAHYKVTFSPDVELAEMINAPYASIETVEIEPEEPQIISVEQEQEEPEIEKPEAEREEIEEVYENPANDNAKDELEEDEREQEEPGYSEQYDEEYRPIEAANGLFWLFFLVVAGLILFFAGQYFCPMIGNGGRRTVTPDSVVVFSHSVHKPQVTDSLKAKAQQADSAALKAVDVPKTQTEKTSSDKEYRVRDGERLNTIALREYGHKAFWVYIYDENRNAIHNPDLIEQGMTINIPPAAKYGIDRNSQESVNKALELEQKYKPE